MLIEMQGVCKYCGQVGMVKVPEDCGQDEVDAAVSRKCICEGAEREMAIITARDNLRSLSGQNALVMGYEYELDGEVVAELNRMIPLVYDRVLPEIKVVEPGGDTIKIWSKIKGVGVQRTHKVDRKL